MFDYDLLRDTLAWDDGVRAVLGLPPGALVSYQETFLRGVHSDDRAGADVAVQASLDTAGDGRFEAGNRTIGIEDGKLRHVAAHGRTFFEDGEAARLLGAIHDVADARFAEARLRETEQRLRLADRATTDPICDRDLIRDHATWNEAIETAFGHSLDDIESTGGWWIDHIHPDDRPRVQASIHAVIDHGGTDWTDDYRFRRADGSYADVRDRGFVIRGERGEPLRMIDVMLDQSERVTTERQSRQEATDLMRRQGRLSLTAAWHSHLHTEASPAWGKPARSSLSQELAGAAGFPS